MNDEERQAQGGIRRGHSESPSEGGRITAARPAGALRPTGRANRGRPAYGSHRPGPKAVQGHRVAVHGRTPCMGAPSIGDRVAVERDRVAGYACGWEILTSQGTPNLSVSIPNSSPQTCFCNGIVTVPPSESFSQ